MSLSQAWKKAKSATSDAWKSANRYISGQKGGDYDFEMVGAAAPGINKFFGVSNIAQALAYQNFLKSRNYQKSTKVHQEEFKELYKNAADKEQFRREWESMGGGFATAPSSPRSPRSSRSSRSASPAMSSTSTSASKRAANAYEKYSDSHNYDAFKANFLRNPNPIVVELMDGTETFPRTAGFARIAWNKQWQKSPERQALVKAGKVSATPRKVRDPKGPKSPQKIVSERMYGEKGAIYKQSHPNLSGKDLYKAFQQDAAVQQAISQERGPSTAKPRVRKTTGPISPYHQFQKDHPEFAVHTSKGDSKSPNYDLAGYNAEKSARKAAYARFQAAGQYKKLPAQKRGPQIGKKEFVDALVARGASPAEANAAFTAAKLNK